LAKAFINYPRVLLLDEPTASLDPDIAKYLRDFILEERKQYKVSIVFTSHNMKEVEEICDRVIIINAGKIIANDTPLKLARRIDVTEIELMPDKKEELEKFCREQNIQSKTEGKYITITTKESHVAKIIQDLTNKNIAFEEISIHKPTLEDYFLKVATQETL
jgi:ABC-2 type transport system ATP-binding protein